MATSCGGSSKEQGSTVFGGASGVDAGPDSSSTGGGGTGGGSLFDGSIDDAATSGDCTTAADCDGGVCVNGICCASAEQVCGDLCCDGAEVCSFGRCLVPGATCQTTADCADGEFCQTGIGTDPVDAGAPAPGCTQPIPAEGRCLDLPPICPPGDAGAGDAGTGSCVDECEFRPPVGQLDAVQKWQWGLDNPPTTSPASADVWATPMVGRVADANCDGKVDQSDPPNVVFVSGDAQQTCCSCGGFVPSTCLTGVLRVLDGRNGQEVWSLDRAKPGNLGFAGLSVALGDVNGDNRTDVVAMTGDGYIAVIRDDGQVLAISDLPVNEAGAGNFGWGGGIALGDMNGDGNPEIAYGRSVYTMQAGAVTQLFVGDGGRGGGQGWSLSFFADLDQDGTQELVAGNVAYRADGTRLWTAPTGVPDGINAVGDFDGNGTPEVVVVAQVRLATSAESRMWLLNGLDGTIAIGPVTLATDVLNANGSSSLRGGPPTVADFDGDSLPEIGVALKQEYQVLEPDFSTPTLTTVWSAANHDLSSSITGSSVFDFQGDGRAEVIYNDECFLWVYDGPTGNVLFATPTTSFTATEASIVADVDGDGHSEMVMISNGANPSASGWGCDVAPWNAPDPAMNRPAWVAPAGAPAYRGITVFGDRQNSWVGTRTMWNQHAYSVSNVCDSRDSACDAPNLTGSIPAVAKRNWTVPWLNNFRQNVQDQGIFDAPDAVVSLSIECSNPVVLFVTVENIGLAGLPAGVVVGVFVDSGGSETQIGSVTTTIPLLPGQSEKIRFTAPAGAATSANRFVSRIIIDPANRTFNECREDNNESNEATASCGPN